VEPDELDQGHDLWLCSAEPDAPAANPEAARQHREVDHQRGVRECQFGEVDDDVCLRANRPRQRAATDSLGCPVLVAAAAECGGGFIESDDYRNLPNRAPQWQG
jgi:hypothetical protein